MRINIIGNFRNGTGVTQDARLVRGIFSHALGEDIEVRAVPHFHPHCDQAEVNVFIENINPSLFVYAAKNIWIPNPEWTNKNWEPYANMIDEIWVKTREAGKLFEKWVPDYKIRYVGWTSIDKVMPEKKNFHKAIVPTGKNFWRNPKPILQAYWKVFKTNSQMYHRLPELYIVYDPKLVQVPATPVEMQDKIHLCPDFMEDKKYDELLHECGLCICMSAAEGFGHAVNEAMSAGCIPMLSPIGPFMELTKNAIWVSSLKITPHPECIADLEDVSVDSIIDALSYYLDKNVKEKYEISAKVRKEYEERHEFWVTGMNETIVNTIKEIPTYSLEERLPKEAELPSVSVVTLTKDRRPFMHLAKYCFLGQAYPQEKLEWVIVDDGIDQIKDVVSDLPNVKYILLEGENTIGKKRNIGVEQAKHDIIVMMDDDDVYPGNSILSRVAMMLTEPKKQCLFSTVIPCYDIHGKSSFMNVPPISLPMSQRVSEATLCFTREFWNERKFPEEQIAEGDKFVSGREQACREMSPQDVIVSLAHKKNTSSRRLPPMEEPNGSHYGFSEELFTLITEIAEGI